MFPDRVASLIDLRPISVYQSDRDDCTGFRSKSRPMIDRCMFDTALAAESSAAPADPISFPNASPMNVIPSLDITEPGPEDARL